MSEIKTVQLIDYHKPSLPAGSYQVKIKQNIEIKNNNQKNIEIEKLQKFHIQGNRFQLPPQTIYGVYPAVGTNSNYSKVLPHIMLNRSTLPWERQPNPSFWSEQKIEKTTLENTPWLALLLFHEKEINKPQGIKLEQILTGREYLLNEQIDIGKDSEISMIDIPKQLFQLILPTPEELQLLTHVRQGTTEDGTKTELAVMISNRLPKANCLNTVHLVSLEHNFSQTPDQFIRLISLKTWDFSCNDDQKNEHFQHLVKNLNQSENNSPLTTLRLPSKNVENQSNNKSNQYLEMGYVPLLHNLRNGEKMVSFYHSPLLPGKSLNQTLFEFPIKTADDLLMYNSEAGLFDVSYSCAWQLGRLLALQDKNFSVNLYNWKRKQNLTVVRETNTIDLLFNNPEIQINEQIQSLINWFTDIRLLKNIPFNYLVPAPEMLPLESLRFFWVDSLWLDCLIDGAFGIGNVFISTESYGEYKEKIAPFQTNKIVTGFLLRSEVVTGYPSIEIKGFNDQQLLPILRRERLGDQVLICLFDGEVSKIEINQKAETLHFGFSSYVQGQLIKNLRNSETEKKLTIETKHWYNEENRVINLQSLANSLIKLLNKNQLNSSELALEMIEGSSVMEFKKVIAITLK